MPKNAKIAPPAAAKTARTAAAARHARNSARLRSAGESDVIATKMGAAEIGLMTEKSDENARNANCWSEGVSFMGPYYPGHAACRRESETERGAARAAPLFFLPSLKPESAPHQQESGADQ